MVSMDYYGRYFGDSVVGGNGESNGGSWPCIMERKKRKFVAGRVDRATLEPGRDGFRWPYPFPF